MTELVWSAEGEAGFSLLLPLDVVGLEMASGKRYISAVLTFSLIGLKCSVEQLLNQVNLPQQRWRLWPPINTSWYGVDPVTRQVSH